MRRFGTVVAFFGLLASLLVGCEPGQTSIPPGAQRVRVVATASEVRLDPAIVHAGDVYLVLDVPQHGIELVQHLGGAAESPGPLSSDELGRLAENADAEGVAIEVMAVGCCGNVYKKTLPAGRYAFLLTVPDENRQPGLRPLSMAVLEVLP